MRWELATPCSRALRAISRLHTRVLLLSGLAVSCTTAPTDDGVTYGETESAISVASAVTASCSTSIVKGLSLQIAREGECIRPGALVPFSAGGNLVFASNAVLPFLHSTARTDLKAEAVNHRVTLASGYRTLAQQFLLVRWNALNRCGITVTAAVGRSNHETGRAADLSNASSVVSSMAAHHWAHDVAGDPPHFDHLSSPDNRGLDVRAFQRLWNRNHPGDLISVDGIYGPQTESRLRASPAGGFAKGAGCSSLVADADDPFLTDVSRSIEGPDLVAPDVPTPYQILIANDEDADWPATTRLVTADRTASQLYDRDSWTSPSEAGEIGLVVPAHGTAEILVTLRAPPVTEDTAFSTTLGLFDANGRQLGTIPLSLTATPNGAPDTSGENGDIDDGSTPPDDGEPTPVDDTGCNAGGSSAGFVLVGAVLLALRRRRQPPR